MTQNFNSDCKICVEELENKLFSVTNKFLSDIDSKRLVKFIIRAELMGVSTHGLHYFNHSVYPLLKRGVNEFKIVLKENAVLSEGRGGDIGILNLYECLKKASSISSMKGICLISIKNPGKVGALRVYADELITKDKLLFLFKNTASTQGTLNSKNGLLGTNPFCIALPSTNFIFDTSTSTVATNSIRLMNKQNQKFPFHVGYNNIGNKTNNPKDLLSENAYLSTFSDGPFWYKSFFLALAIESIAALAGGKTGSRVGEKKGSRLNSKEGMLGIVIDKSTFPYFLEYKKEIEMLFDDIKDHGIRIPGYYDKNQKNVYVSKNDWDFINDIK